MKTIVKITAILFIATLGLGSCNDNYYGYFYSAGRWQIDRYYYNGSDSTLEYTRSHENYILYLKTSNYFNETCILNGAPYGVSGTWEVYDNSRILRLYDAFNGTREFDILLTSTSTLRIRKGVEEWSLKRP